MVDFVALQQTAKRLIDANGRSVTFQKLSAVATDPTKPWRGRSEGGTTTTKTQIAAFVSPAGAASLGLRTEANELVRRSEKFLLTAHEGADLETFDTILDGGQVFKILFVETLQPASTRVMYIIGVAR